ncbi:hypothetical protein GCM10027294_52800 [Marinactinospora endophytica]
MAECSEKLAEPDPVFGGCRERSLMMGAVELLGRQEYTGFERDLPGTSTE